MHESAGERDAALAVLRIAMRKFGATSLPVWSAAWRFHLNGGDDAAARETLQRALRTGLPSREHVSATVRFAQDEYDCQGGSAERARTVLEGVVSSYPRRLDVWNVYIDKEVKAGSIDHARSLHERLSALKYVTGARALCCVVCCAVCGRRASERKGRPTSCVRILTNPVERTKEASMQSDPLLRSSRVHPHQ